nr:SRPBCC family protein [Burkholderia humptydooensis]
MIESDPAVQAGAKGWSRTMTRLTGRRDTAARLIKASRQTIYDAFVRCDAVSTWLPPQGATAQVQAFEPWTGGRFQMTLAFATASGKSTANTDVVAGRFVDLVPQERIVQAFEFAAADPAFAGTMTMTWSLRAAEGGTIVTVTAENVPPGIDRADHETGMNSSLANLAAYVE